MALGKKCGNNLQRSNEGFIGMGLLRSSSFGSKRVALSANDVMEVDCLNSTPTKKPCFGETFSFIINSDKSPLEVLPQDILIRILCGVEHYDLKNLFKVSKSIREATVVAKQWHFAYSTPKKTLRFRDAVESLDLTEFDEVEVRAPKQSRVPRSELSKKNLADISVALFNSDGENWPRRVLFVEMETEM